MHKRIVTFIIAVALIVACSACGAEEKTPEGVINKDGGDWYIVKMPEGKSVKDYFTLTGESGYMHMTNMGQMDKSESMGGANYSEVSEGGWIVYGESVFMYIPYNISSSSAQMACSTLILNRDNCMSLEDAKQYISFLND